MASVQYQLHVIVLMCIDTRADRLSVRIVCIVHFEVCVATVQTIFCFGLSVISVPIRRSGNTV